MKRADLADALVVLGTTVAACGIWQWSWPAALVFVGLVMAGTGAAAIRHRIRKPEE